MSAKTPTIRFALTAAVLLSAAITAPAQAFADDEARRAILELREQVKRYEDQNRQTRLQFADQIQTMQQEMARMRGQLEQLAWQANLQQGGTGAPGSNAPSVSDPQEQVAYETPMGLFRSGKYQEAAAGFQNFLQSYPNSQLVPEVRFYQGSSRYATKDFKGAIQGLESMIQSSPDDPRAPDALLVIAASQVELGNMAGAKSSLQKIVKNYPNTSAAETAKSRLQLL